MSTCAVMLVKDELDIVGPVLHHLAASVDEILVSDNLSTDGTYELLLHLEAGDLKGVLAVGRDFDVAHYQSRKTTALAMQALERGHSWVVPCDADEVWYATDGRPLGAFLGGLAPDVQIVAAELYHHLPTALDPAEPNPLARIGWRNRNRGSLPKVACRLRPDLVIHDGNHGASTSGTGLRSGGLVVRHFSWRSAAQYANKLANGYRAFAATDLPATTGEHWRKYDPEAPDFEERVNEHFWTWFYSADPHADDALIYDPVTPLLLG